MSKSIGRMINLLSRKSQGYLSNILDKYNLTVAEQPFFMALRHAEGITQEELTTLVCVDKALTARSLKSLEKKGLITREQDEKDRRQNRIYLTDTAKELAPLIWEELHHFNELLTMDLDKESKDILYHSLLKLEDNLNRMTKQ